MFVQVLSFNYNAPVLLTAKRCHFVARVGGPFNPQLGLVVMILGKASLLVTSRTGGRDFCSHLGWTFGIAKHTCRRLEQNVVFFHEKY